MCGFTGYLLKDTFENRSDAILNMLELQRHRGPDDSGILGINTLKNLFEELNPQNPDLFSNNPNLIFGFNRLSILDLSHAGHQPMQNKEMNVALMMNGEVYNAFDFKPELIEKGYSFKSNSDTEVVLNLYLAYGLKGMLDRINGMFAIVIYDGRTRELFLIRDRVGIKPLYLLRQKNRIAFASELKSFKALPDFKFELDNSRISEFLVFRNTINNTLFKDIINIEPGTYFSLKENGECVTNKYYDLRTEGGTKISNTDLASTLRDAVKRQMISDVKLGCQLSGGIDSSMVTKFASEALPKGSLETISIVFDDPKFSEKYYMDQVVEKLELKSHQYTLDASVYLELIDEAIWHFEHPLNHPNTIGIKLLSREAKKHVTVLLSGEGADEALAGYSRFLPKATNLFSKESLKRIFRNRNRLFDFLRQWIHKDKRYLLQTAYGSLSIASSLYKNFSSKEAVKSRLDIWESIKDNTPRKLRKYELLTYLPDLLMRQDKMSMAHTIENRVPFLDNEMIKVSLSLSDSELVKLNKDKWEGKFLLKALCANTFGDSFSFRKKVGFGIPLKEFFGSEAFQKRWNEKLLPGMKKRNLFHVDLLQNWMLAPHNMNPDQIESVWLMIGFEIWATQYLD
jgi:asparagine synthase (glutamine-hydrolysing)